MRFDELVDFISKWIDPSTFIGAMVLAAIMIAIGVVVTRFVRRMMRETLKHDRSERIDAISLQFLTHLEVLMIWLVLATFYAHLVPALNRLGTTLLAGVSLVSVILGFAAQQTLGNLIAGVSLVLYKPFRRGDRLQIDAPTGDSFETGTVEDISLGYTQLLTDDGRRIVVANATMAQQTMIKLPPADPPAGNAKPAEPAPHVPHVPHLHK